MIIQNKLEELGIPKEQINKILRRIYCILDSQYAIDKLHYLDVSGEITRMSESQYGVELIIQAYLDEATIDESVLITRFENLRGEEI